MIKHFKYACAGIALLLAGSAPHALAQTRPAAIKVENLTRFSNAAIQEKFVELAPPALSARLAASKHALWALVDSANLKDGQNYCIAFVGLTHPASAGRNARLPEMREVNVVRTSKRGAMNDDEWLACRGDALINAMNQLIARDWDADIRKVDAATAETGSRKPEPAKPGIYHLFYASAHATIDDIDAPEGFGNAFDYRQLQMNALSTALDFGDRIVCYALVGMSARAPDGRNPRVPGYRYGKINVATVNGAKADEGQMRQCERTVTRAAVDDMFAESWDQKGFLDKIEKTREDGLPLVLQAKGAKVAKAAAPKTVRSTTNQVNSATCTNSCVNGSCVREFPDGRKEKFQAQRVYNPFKNDWEWKAEGCGG